MTASTEKERAEFEAWKEDYALTFEPNYDEHLEADCRAAFLAGMQAARRAQVVTEGYALISKDALRAWGKLEIVEQACIYPLAAAPQPPEAAPVELPKPFAITWHDSIQYPCGFPWFDRDKYPDGTKLYTEQQVRQLLADHGVK